MTAEMEKWTRWFRGLWWWAEVTVKQTYSNNIHGQPTAQAMPPPIKFPTLTFLSASTNTENKIRPFIKKLIIGDFVDFPFFPMFSSPSGALT